MKLSTSLRLGVVGGAVLSALVSFEPVRADDADNIVRIREKCLEFLQSLGSKQVDTYVKGRPSDFDRAYKTYHYLANRDKITEMAGYVTAESNPDAKHAFNLLKQWLELETIHASIGPEIDGANNYLADTEIIVGGEEIPLHNVVTRMSLEPDRSSRRQWSFAFKEFLENVNVYRLQEVHLSNTKAKELGYQDFQTFLSAYKDFDIERAQAEARSLVDQTNALYQRLLEGQIAATFGDDLTIQSVRFYDMPRIRVMSRFDEGLPEKKAFETLEGFFKALGLDLQQRDAGNISDRAAEVPNARDGVSGYVDQPVRNMMTIGYKPVSGFATYTGMLREAGRLLYAGRAGGAYYEHHFFGDPTCAFAIGYLFQNLMEDAAWLKKHTKLDDQAIEGVREAYAFHRLAEAREYAGRILVLPSLYEGVKQPGELYEQVMEPIRKWGHTEVDRVLFMEANDEFDCVGRLRGMVLAVAIENALVKSFGEQWWRDKQSAAFLSGLWAKGQRQRAVEFAATVELQDFDPSLLVTDFDGFTAVIE